jgi:hypothetical protein
VATSTPTPAPVPVPTSPRTFWQYLVVYPTLALALGGSIPTVMQHVRAWRLDTQASRVQLVEEQRQLWERNADCLIAHGIYEIDGPDNLVVKVTLCPSGDALLRYHFNEWPPRYKWVGRPDRPTKP